MGLEVYPKVIAVPSMPSGFASLPPGYGLNKIISVREATDGVVAVGENFVSLGGGNGRLLNGVIDISHCTNIMVYAQVSFGSGPLTAIDIFPAFLEENSGIALLGYIGHGTIAAGITTLTRAQYRFSSATQPICFPLKNPGAQYLGFYVSGTGVATGSSMILRVGLGWGTADLLGT